MFRKVTVLGLRGILTSSASARVVESFLGNRVEIWSRDAGYSYRRSSLAKNFSEAITVAIKRWCLND